MAIHLLTKQRNNRYRTACGVSIERLMGNLGTTPFGGEVAIAYKNQRFDCPRCRNVAKRQPEVTRELWVESSDQDGGGTDRGPA